MLLRSVQAWWFALICLLAIFAGYCVEGNEGVYPLGTAFASYADFSSSPSSKGELAKTLTRAASATPGGSFLLTKASTDDVANGLDIFWFGKRPTATDGTGWFKNGRHADIRSADDLGLSNLSGGYSFADEQTASTFERVARESGASVESRGSAQCWPILGLQFAAM